MPKLTVLQVLEIATDTRPYAEVAAEYEISTVMVGLIRTGQRWSAQTGIDPVDGQSKLTDELREQIRASTEPTRILAERFQVHPATIRRCRARPA